MAKYTWINWVNDTDPYRMARFAEDVMVHPELGKAFQYEVVGKAYDLSQNALHDLAPEHREALEALRGAIKQYLDDPSRYVMVLEAHYQLPPQPWRDELGAHPARGLCDVRVCLGTTSLPRIVAGACMCLRPMRDEFVSILICDLLRSVIPVPRPLTVGYLKARGPGWVIYRMHGSENRWAVQVTPPPRDKGERRKPGSDGWHEGTLRDVLSCLGETALEQATAQLEIA